MRFFIKRPSAIEQLRKCANYSTQTSAEQIEEELREALEHASNNYSRSGCRYLFRVSIPNHPTVCVIGTPAKSGKDYDCVITRVQTEEEACCAQRRARRTRRNDSKMVILRYQNGDGKAVITEHAVDRLRGAILELLKKGVPEHAIEVLKPVPWNLDIVIEENAA